MEGASRFLPFLPAEPRPEAPFTADGGARTVEPSTLERLSARVDSLTDQLEKLCVAERLTTQAPRSRGNSTCETLRLSRRQTRERTRRVARHGKKLRRELKDLASRFATTERDGQNAWREVEELRARVQDLNRSTAELQARLRQQEDYDSLKLAREADRQSFEARLAEIALERENAERRLMASWEAERTSARAELAAQLTALNGERVSLLAKQEEAQRRAAEAEARHREVAAEAETRRLEIERVSRQWETERTENQRQWEESRVHRAAQEEAWKQVWEKITARARFLESEGAQAQARIADFETKTNEIEAERRASQQEFERLSAERSKEREEAERRLDELRRSQEIQASNWRQEQEVLAERSRALEAERDVAQAQIASHETRANEIEAERRASQLEIERLSAEWEAERTATASRIDEMEARRVEQDAISTRMLAALQDRAAWLESERNLALKQNAEWKAKQGDRTTSDATTAEIEAWKARLESERGDAERKLAEVQARHAEAEAAAATRFAELQTRAAALEAEHDQTSRANEAWLAQRAEFEAALATHQAELERVHGQHKSEREEFERRFAELDASRASQEAAAAAQWAILEKRIQLAESAAAGSRPEFNFAADHAGGPSSEEISRWTAEREAERQEANRRIEELLARQAEMSAIAERERNELQERVLRVDAERNEALRCNAEWQAHYSESQASAAAAQRELEQVTAELAAERENRRQLIAEYETLRTAGPTDVESPRAETKSEVATASDPTFAPVEESQAEIPATSASAEFDRGEPCLDGARDSDSAATMEEAHCDREVSEAPPAEDASTSNEGASVFASGDESTADESREEETASQAEAAPTGSSFSAAAVLARMGLSISDDDASAGAESSSVAAPRRRASDVPATPATPPENEDDVQEYMQKLLARMRTGGPATAPAPVTRALQSAPTKVEAPAPAAPVAEVVHVPLQDLGEIKPRARASASTTDMAALRDLANQTARMNVTTHALKRTKHDMLSRVLLAGGGFFLTGLLVWVWQAGATLALFPAMVCFAATLFWIAQSALTARRARGIKVHAPAENSTVSVAATETVAQQSVTDSQAEAPQVDSSEPAPDAEANVG